MYAYVLASALLMHAPDSLDELPGPDMDSHLRAATQNLAIDWELLDSREVRYILARPEDYTSDINLLRRRNAELYDAPFAVDGFRFPDRAIVNEVLSYNRSYRQQLDTRQTTNPAQFWQIKKVQQETDQLYQIWDTVRDARCEYYYITVRRQALKRLRDSLGEDDYYEGILPPYVPLWRFETIK